MQRLAAACIGICVAFAGGCNQRVAVLDTPAAPTAPPAATPPQPGVASIDVQPPAVNGGDGATGMVTLTGPALPPGVTVSLSSSDDAAVIAPEVMVPPGSTFARFAVNSRRLPVDRAATITGSTAASTAATRFEVWTIEAPIYFNFFSDDGDAIGRGDFGRFVPGTSAFAAVCDRNEVRILITAPGPEFWSATFRAPGDEPLAQRFYDNALRAGFNGVDPGVQIAANGTPLATDNRPEVLPWFARPPLQSFSHFCCPRPRSPRRSRRAMRNSSTAKATACRPMRRP